ncbi:YibE/F family protein [Corynebacterium oculi]|uniref:YibE/F-like protein n=1 Tax=Corynebacterium oculi TaxID=1544416 RepID=A0A0Q0UAW2_9CORY|nr:YibE/F family protein [Corynebacterium oculi]KQB83304.1 YibE/F-like protein [Corynebacterium oculi]
MGRHRPSPTALTLPRLALLIGITLSCLASAIAVALNWPNAERAEVSETFASSAFNRTLVEGTVTLVDGNACNSPSIGTIFDGSPVTPLESSGQDCRRALVDITSGEFAGKRTMLVSYGMPGEPELQEGEKIHLTETRAEDGRVSMAFADYQRGTPLLIWGIVIVVALIVFAGWRGFRALIGLAVTLAMIGFFLLPALASGRDSALLAVITGALVLLVVVPLVHGLNWKSAAALGGTLLALLVAAGLTSIGLRTTEVRGLGSDENLTILLYLPEVSVLGLLAAGFIIGTLGVLNDVTIAQASTINELSALDPEASPWRLFLGAMKVGQDHIASVVYTLVLSYTGAALPLLLLISVAQRPLGETLSSDVVATELLRSGIGGLALILAVPLTTLIAAWTVPERSPK